MRWTTPQLLEEPPAKLDAFAWQVYLELIGAGELQARQAEVNNLLTPPAKTEHAQNQARMDAVKRLREHIAAIKLLAFPDDEPEVIGG